MHTKITLLLPGVSPNSSPSKPSTTARWSSQGQPPVSPPRPGNATAAVTNETLAWELLYNLNYQLPTEEAEASWKEATGEANVMQEAVPRLQEMSSEEARKATQARVRRIAEAAFWDSIAGASAYIPLCETRLMPYNLCSIPSLMVHHVQMNKCESKP